MERKQNIIEVHITEDQYENLYSYSTKTDKKKGDVIEYIAKEILYEFGAEIIKDITDEKKQLNLGDLLIIDKLNRKKTVEIKTSHQFKNIDKLAMDYKYFKYYHRQKNKLIPYIQQNTLSEFGWLFDNKANILLAFNPKSCKAYIILNFSKLAEDIISDVEKYISKLNNGEVTWYLRNHNNYINSYLEGSIKKDGDLKQALIVNFLLNDKSFKHYNCKYQIVQVDLFVGDMNLKEYKESRQERKTKDIIIDKSKEKSSHNSHL